MKRRAQQDRRNEKNPSYAATRKLRDAIKEFNKGIGKELTLESLERWESRPQFDADDSDQVRRVAEIYMLELMDGQEFEVRARSDRPGRPLVCLDISVTFPNEEQVAFGEQFHEPYAEYLIAAKLPRWKVVWKYSGRAW